MLVRIIALTFSSSFLSSIFSAGFFYKLKEKREETILKYKIKYTITITRSSVILITMFNKNYLTFLP